MAAANLDPKTWTRSYAVTGYYLPVKDRNNLTVSYLSGPQLDYDPLRCPYRF